jgi:polygalacturonase
MSGADFAARGLALKTLSRLGSNDPGNGSALINHRGSSANVVGRKLDEKVNDLLSVRDFGAKGDGVTDDTAAIRNAIHALSSRSSLFFGYRMGTGALYFPEGVYRITESGLLSDTGGFLQSGMTLRGAGKRNTILWLDPAAASADMWFYDNNDTSKMWGVVCEA